MHSGVTAPFREVIGRTRVGRGFNGRPEVIRITLRAAIEFPTFDRDELSALAQARRRQPGGKTLTGAAVCLPVTEIRSERHSRPPRLSELA